MIACPAVDLRGGRVVQLVGGRPEAERVSLPDPVAVARRWVEAGFRALHVVDLDAALGNEAVPQADAATGDVPASGIDMPGDAGPASNRAAIAAILAAVDVPVQVGGGIRDDESADALLDAGAARIVVGTRAVEDPAWLEALATRRPGRVVVAADIRDGLVVTRGWTATTALEATSLLARLDALPLAGVLVTDVSREGRMAGADADRFAALAAATRHPLVASGGIRDVHDLRALARAGIAGAVLGMALYTGALDARATAREFHE